MASISVDSFVYMLALTYRIVLVVEIREAVVGIVYDISCRAIAAPVTREAY